MIITLRIVTLLIVLLSERVLSLVLLLFLNFDTFFVCVLDSFLVRYLRYIESVDLIGIYVG